MPFHVRETAEGLVLAHPAWLGILFLVLGIVLAAYVIRGHAKAQRFGVAVVSLMFFWFSVVLFASRTHVTRDEVRVYEPLRHDVRLSWPEVSTARIERRNRSSWGSSGKFKMTIILYLRDGGEAEVPGDGLSAEDRARVLEYILERIRTPLARVT